MDDKGRVLLCTWHNYPDSYPDGDTVKIAWGPVWTFTDKEIAGYADELSNATDAEMRLRQIVAFAPDAEHSTVTGFWVDPSDVLRPAYQSDPTDDSMTVSFGEDVDEDFKEWFDANILSSYFYGSYPWTRLGYTYDWASILAVMVRELFGAVLVGIVVSFICFFVLRGTKDQIRRIFTSLLAVSASYLLCEYFDFSGAIASVVCGVMFSAFLNYEAYKGNTLELEQFDGFWEILDCLLNSLLYVMLGLSFPHILQMPHVFMMSCAAIVINLIGRSSSVGAMSLLSGKLPDGYDKLSFIKLLTWGGLRGGLSVALAMSTQSFLESEAYCIVLGGTYALVFFTTIVQGMTMSKVYQRIEKNEGVIRFQHEKTLISQLKFTFFAACIVRYVCSVQYVLR